MGPRAGGGGRRRADVNCAGSGLFLRPSSAAGCCRAVKAERARCAATKTSLAGNVVSSTDPGEQGGDRGNQQRVARRARSIAKPIRWMRSWPWRSAARRGATTRAARPSEAVEAKLAAQRKYIVWRDAQPGLASTAGIGSRIKSTQVDLICPLLTPVAASLPTGASSRRTRASPRQNQIQRETNLIGGGATFEGNSRQG